MNPADAIIHLVRNTFRLLSGDGTADRDDYNFYIRRFDVHVDS